MALRPDEADRFVRAIESDADAHPFGISFLLNLVWDLRNQRLDTTDIQKLVLEALAFGAASPTVAVWWTVVRSSPIDTRLLGPVQEEDERWVRLVEWPKFVAHYTKGRVGVTTELEPSPGQAAVLNRRGLTPRSVKTGAKVRGSSRFAFGAPKRALNVLDPDGSEWADAATLCQKLGLGHIQGRIGIVAITYPLDINTSARQPTALNGGLDCYLSINVTSNSPQGQDFNRTVDLPDCKVGIPEVILDEVDFSHHFDVHYVGPLPETPPLRPSPQRFLDAFPLPWDGSTRQQLIDLLATETD